MTSPPKSETAVFGGGCFWCTEATFSMFKGVLSVIPGYTGGIKVKPTYEEVSGGNTGHTEVIQVQFDPSIITYDDLLTVFFAVHDPTQRGGQGNDIGTQYKSAVFYASAAQKDAAEKLLAELTETKAYEKPVVTEVCPLGVFYPAEQDHREYYKRNTDAPYCQIVIAPKLKRLQDRFFALLRHE